MGSIVAGNNEFHLKDIYSTMTSAGVEMTMDHRHVRTIEFLDETIRTVNGVIVKPNQILQGLMKPTLAELERWAAGSCGASESFKYSKLPESIRDLGQTRIRSKSHNLPQICLSAKGRIMQL